MVSINNNSQAANALMNYNIKQRELAKTQDVLSTGLKVASAKDNASTFAIAFGLKSDVATYGTIKDNLTLGGSIVNSSLNVANQVGEQIKTIKTKITQASDQPQGRKLIDQDIQNAVSQIKNFVGSATFNGVNLLDGKMKNAGKTFDVTASLDRDASGNPTLNKLNFQAQDLSVSSATSGLGALFGMSVNRADPTANDTSSKTGLNVQVTTGLAVGESMTFNYVDGQGNNRTLSYTNSTAGALSQAATMDAFMDAHKDTLTGLGFENTHTAATDSATFSRKTGSSNTFTGFTMSGGSAATVKKELEMGFNGQPMQLNDEISLKYKIGATENTITLRVSNSAAGSNLGKDKSNNDVYSIDASAVSGSGATADGIATAIRNTLLSANGGSAAGDFVASGAGVAGTSIELGTVAAGSGKFKISTVGTGTDDVTSAKFTSDFSEVMKMADTAEQAVKNVQAALGSAASRITSQSDFVDSMVTTLNNNVSSLVDADMAKEAAKLSAQQTQAQLGIQAMSVANQSSQSILSLFKG